MHRVLVEKREGKRPIGKPRYLWKDNIKMELREIEWGGMDLTHLVQDRDQWQALVSTVTDLRIP
jgi:hypothetical protein